MWTVGLLASVLAHHAGVDGVAPQLPGHLLAARGRVRLEPHLPADCRNHFVLFIHFFLI